MFGATLLPFLTLTCCPLDLLWRGHKGRKEEVMAPFWEEAVAGRCIRRAATASSKQLRTERPSRACRGPQRFEQELIMALLKPCGVLRGDTQARR